MTFISRALSWREIDSSHRLMAAIVVALGLLNLCCGEIVPEGGGLGWDGVRYATMTRSLPSLISEGQLSSHYAQRILPSAMVRGLLRLAGASFTDANIIRGFQFYNLVLLVAALGIWRRMSDQCSISLGGRWLGFCGLFLNFMGSKHTFYYPVLTDMTALCAGLLALLCFLERRPIALVATTLAGAFTWSIVPGVCAAMLLIFPRSDPPPEAAAPATTIFSLDAAMVSRLIRSGWILLLILSIAGAATLTRILEGDAAAKLVTGLPTLAGVAIALAMLAGSVTWWRTYFARVWTTRGLAALAIAGLLIPWAIGRSLANPSLASPRDLIGIVKIWLLPANGKVLLPLVSVAVWWGPLVLLGLLCWNAFGREARKLGPGYMAVVGLHLFLGLSTEPRAVTFGWPFFVLGVVLAMETVGRTASFKYAFAALTILSAQFWMKINLAPWSDQNEIVDFPRQIYFMHYGLWMNWRSYSVQLSALALGALWLRSTLRPASRAASA